MKITNKYNLPSAIVNAVKNDDYTKGGAHYSISELLSPPRMLALKRIHENELEEDASERIWSLFGKAVHKVAEMANEEGVAERRLTVELDGIKVSGAIDYYDVKAKRISDYKTCSVYKLKNGEFKDWEEQQNMYALLSYLNQIEVQEIEIVAFARDWRPSESKREESYPPQSQTIRLPLWSYEKSLAFLKERILVHESAKKSLPNCTPEERWAKPSQWAIKKKGGAKAIPGGLYANEAIAYERLKELGSGYEIEFRPGENTRCNYCPVSDFCDQYKQSQGVSSNAGKVINISGRNK